MDFNYSQNFCTPIITYNQYLNEKNLVSEKNLAIQFTDLSDLESSRVVNYDLIQKRICNKQLKKICFYEVQNNYCFNSQCNIKTDTTFHVSKFNQNTSDFQSQLRKVSQTQIFKQGIIFVQKKNKFKFENQNRNLEQKFFKLQQKFKFQIIKVQNKLIDFQQKCKQIKKLFLLRDFSLFSKVQNISMKQQQLQKQLLKFKEKTNTVNLQRNFVDSKKQHIKKSKTLSCQSQNSVYYQTGLVNCDRTASTTLQSFYQRNQIEKKENYRQNQQCSINKRTHSIKNIGFDQNQNEKKFQFEKIQIKFL